VVNNFVKIRMFIGFVLDDGKVEPISGMEKDPIELLEKRGYTVYDKEILNDMLAFTIKKDGVNTLDDFITELSELSGYKLYFEEIYYGMEDIRGFSEELKIGDSND